jgi:phage terminase large subunit
MGKLQVLPHFQPLYQSGYRHYVLYGGRASGKSWGVAQAIVYYTSTFACNVLCVRSIQKSIQESSYRLIVETIERADIADNYVITDTYLQHKETGSRITFMGVRTDPQKIKSTEGIDVLWWEEADTAEQEEIDLVIPTIRKSGSILIWTLNPRYELDPISKMFLPPNDPPPKTCLIPVSWQDNPYFPEVLRAEMEDMKQKDPAKYLHVWEGHFASTSAKSLIQMGEVLACENLEVGVVNSQIIRAGIDVGAGGDPTVIALMQGRKLLEMIKLDVADQMILAERVNALLQEKGVDLCAVDYTAIGHGFGDRLCQLFGSQRVILVNFAHGAVRPDLYLNKRCELWGTMADKIKSGIHIPRHAEWTDCLEEELVAVNVISTANEKLKLEDKEAIRKRIGRSVDYGDALALVLSVPDRPKVASQPISFGGGRPGPKRYI